MKYAHLEEKTNKLLGWYDDSIHSEIPTPNMEVTDKIWQDAINLNANCFEDGKFIVKDFRTEEEIIQQELQAKINEAQTYLNQTDWYVVRFVDEGTETPEEVKAKRQEAREFIRQNNGIAK